MAKAELMFDNLGGGGSSADGLVIASGFRNYDSYTTMCIIGNVSNINHISASGDGYIWGVDDSGNGTNLGAIPNTFDVSNYNRIGWTQNGTARTVTVTAVD